MKTKKGKTAKANGKARAKNERRAIPATGGLTPLKRVCADLDIDPKRARVKLRRAWRKEDEKNVAFHERGARWDLTAAQVREVKAILAPQ